MMRLRSHGMTTDFSLMIRVLGAIRRFLLKLIRALRRKHRALLGA
jgi:hypothetical protein